MTSTKVGNSTFNILGMNSKVTLMGSDMNYGEGDTSLLGIGCRNLPMTTEILLQGKVASFWFSAWPL
jgi:hypothetical protein